MLKEQIDAAIDWIDERRGILHMRRHMAGMFKGLSNFKQTRIDMLRADRYDDLMIILHKVASEWGELQVEED
jgi:tRNA-dihydrouridine synthase